MSSPVTLVVKSPFILSGFASCSILSNMSKILYPVKPFYEKTTTSKTPVLFYGLQRQRLALFFNLIRKKENQSPLLHSTHLDQPRPVVKRKRYKACIY